MVMSLIESLTRIKNAVYGREVREAIHDGVFRANQIADGADTKADNTQLRQDAVEDFNTQVIQEMTDKDVISAPEIIQARGGKATLGERLDDTSSQLAHVISQVNNLAIANVKDFGAVGDGVTDDTQALQDCFDHIEDGTTVIMSGVYSINKSIHVSNSDIKIEGNNSKILWHGSEPLGGTPLSHAAIMFDGERTSTISNIVSVDTSGYMRVEVEDPSLFKTGDKVHINIDGGVWDQAYLDYHPSVSTPTTITSIDGNFLSLDHIVPFTFDTPIVGRITLLNMLTNLEVRNLHFVDMITEFDESDNRSWVSGMQFRYTDGVRVFNYTSTNHKVKGLRFTNSMNFYVQDSKFEYPLHTEPACGYGVQVAASTKGYFLRINGVRNRHLIDFSASSHSKVVQSSEHSALNTAFDCHGLSEHDIIFDACQGDLVIGNGIHEFPSTTRDITINQCKLDGFYFGFVHGLKIIDSDIVNSGTGVYQNFGDVHIVRSKIKLMTPKTFTMRTRGFIVGDFILENSELYLGGGLSLTNFENVKIVQSKIETDAYNNIVFSNITKVSINGNLIKNTILYLRNTSKEINVHDNELVSNHENSSSARMIGLNQSHSNTPSVVTFANNRIVGVTQSTWIRTADTPFSGSIWRFNDNTFEGKIGEYITNYAEVDAVKLLSRGNVNRSTLSSSYLVDFEN